jgi:hypothetical protein
VLAVLRAGGSYSRAGHKGIILLSKEDFRPCASSIWLGWLESLSGNYPVVAI